MPGVPTLATPEIGKLYLDLKVERGPANPVPGGARDQA
jgi:hypothetical protein